MDPVFPGPTSESYRHWGTLKTGGGDSIPEPNNQQPQEYCAVCNATQTYGGAYGWADANCANKFVSMCRIQGECYQGVWELYMVAWQALNHESCKTYTTLVQKSTAVERRAIVACQALPLASC